MKAPKAPKMAKATMIKNQPANKKIPVKASHPFVKKGS